MKRQSQTRDPGKKLTLSLDAYCGTFKGQYNLPVKIEMVEGGMVLRLGNLVADVTHWHHDTFRARLRQRRLAEEQDWYLTFTIAEAKIAKLHIHSEHDVQADFVLVGRAGN